MNKGEMWKCPLCATNHASRAGKARKYFFSNVCAVFTSYSIEQKSKFLGKNFLCKVCSGPKDQSDHPKGQDCPRVNQLGCKLCNMVLPVVFIMPHPPVISYTPITKHKVHTIIMAGTGNTRMVHLAAKPSNKL